MKVSYINAYFNKENLKREAKTAGLSGALSAGLTLAVNKGQNPKNAAVVGLFAAGVSLAIGAAQKAAMVKQYNIKMEGSQNNSELRLYNP